MSTKYLVQVEWVNNIHVIREMNGSFCRRLDKIESPNSYQIIVVSFGLLILPSIDVFKFSVPLYWTMNEWMVA